MRILHRTNWALVDQAVVSGGNFATTVLAARFLGIEQFGEFAIAFLVLLFVNSIHTSFNTEPMMSIGALQTEHPKDKYFGGTLIQQLIFSALLFLLSWAFLESTVLFSENWNIHEIALPISCAILFAQLQDYFRKYFFTEARSIPATVVDIIRYVFQLLLIIVITFATAPGSANIFWAIAVSSFIASVVGWRMMRPVSFDRAVIALVVRRHWRSSRYLVLSALLMWFADNLFTLMSGALLGAASVGAITSCMSLLNVLNVLFLGLDNIISVEAAKRGRSSQLRPYLVKVTIAGILLTVVIVAVFVVWAEFFLRIAFGSEFEQFGFLLRWLSGVMVLQYIFNILYAGCRAIENTKIIFTAYLWAVSVSLASAYFLISEFELYGVILGKWAVVAIEVYLVAKFLNRELKRYEHAQ